MDRGKWLLTLIALLWVPEPSRAGALLFSTDFEGSTPANFSAAGAREGIQGYPVDPFGNWFLRNASGGNPGAQTTLTLSSLPAHSFLTISFALAAIDSWDGPGNDAFNVNLDGTTIFTSPYSNFDYDLPFNGVKIWSGVGGFNSAETVNDSAYRISLMTPHTGSTAVFDFFSAGPAGGDESWAIDNVAVRADVPEPGTMLLLLSGVGVITMRRRK